MFLCHFSLNNVSFCQFCLSFTPNLDFLGPLVCLASVGHRQFLLSFTGRPWAGVSCDEAAVDAAWAQSSLECTFLRSQNGYNGLIKHSLQAFLCQRWTFNITAGTNLERHRKRDTFLGRTGKSWQSFHFPFEFFLRSKFQFYFVLEKREVFIFLTSFASFWPCSVTMGFSLTSFSLAIVLGSSRRSIYSRNRRRSYSEASSTWGVNCTSICCISLEDGGWDSIWWGLFLEQKAPGNSTQDQMVACVCRLPFHLKSTTAVV